QAPLFRPVLKNLIPSRNLIVEPEGRGTAVAIAYGTGAIAKRLSDNTVVCVMPADHYVAPVTALQRTRREALPRAASQASIVAFDGTCSFETTIWRAEVRRVRPGGCREEPECAWRPCPFHMVRRG